MARKAVKIKEDLPHYWLSEEDNIILCGKIDWLEYLPETDSVHIIDFKTSKYDEDGDSLQLPIYYLLVTNTQKREVSKASYWYLERNDDLTEKELPDEKHHLNG
ncbi:PD-(D/E)XK nuclease family protein [Candidatus Roizmanbacteria bacterium]|nr:MAG: PD-(D/E)XK nuclease family protein [Candidatus Roizmanbacteria bacterium]